MSERSTVAEQSAPRPLLYICPRTGRTVQGPLGRTEQDTEQPSKNLYEAVSCIDCSDTHFVNRATGAVLGAGAKAR